MPPSNLMILTPHSMVYPMNLAGGVDMKPQTPNHLPEYHSVPPYILKCVNMHVLLKALAGDVDPRFVLEVMICCVERTEKSQKCNLSNVKHCLHSWKKDPRKFVAAVQHYECYASTLNDGEYIQIAKTMIDDGSDKLCPLDTYIKENLYPYAMYVTWKDIVTYIADKQYIPEEVQRLINLLLQHVVHKQTAHDAFETHVIGWRVKRPQVVTPTAFKRGARRPLSGLRSNDFSGTSIENGSQPPEISLSESQIRTETRDQHCKNYNSD